MTTSPAKASGVLKSELATSIWNTGGTEAPLVELGLGDPDGNWTLDFWGRNLFDRDYVQVAFDAPLQQGGINAFLGDPRTYGATLRLNF